MKDIQKLQLIQQNMQNLMMQRQQYQAKLDEIENAIMELSNVDTAHKIVGNIMVKSSSESLKKELDENKSLVDTRIKNIEKQEEKLNKEMKRLQENLVKDMKKDDNTNK